MLFFLSVSSLYAKFIPLLKKKLQYACVREIIILQYRLKYVQGEGLQPVKFISLILSQVSH